MAINKIVYGNNVLVDLTNDTVSPGNLQSGATAHSRSGALIRGTANMGGAAPCTILLAAEFDSSVDYEAGDYVIYNGELYRFLFSHSAGAWNISEMRRNNASNELKNVTKSLTSYPFLLESGRYISKTTGNNVAMASGPYSASTWIPICSSFLYFRAYCSTDDAGYAFYDENKKYISGGICPIGSTIGETLLEVPGNARFFRFSVMNQHIAKGVFVKGLNDRNHPIYDHIPFEKGVIYAVSNGSIVRNNSSNAIGSPLLLRSMEPLLRGYRKESNHFYKNLYDKNNVCVGSLRLEGYYNTSGTKVNTPIDYYSFSMTISSPYSDFAAQEVYFNENQNRHIDINVGSVAALENALLEAAEFANPCRIYDIHLAQGTYDLWNGLDFSRISGTGDTAYHRGLEIPSYTNLYGNGNCILDLTIPSTGRSYSTVISCLNTHCVEASVHNITLRTYDGRYCVHDDSYPNVTRDHTIIWDHCKFVHLGRPDTTYTTAAHCYGAGFYSGAKAIFRNCVFNAGTIITGLNWGGIAIHGHTTTGDGTNVNEPFYGEVENCSFLAVGDAILPNAVSGGLERQYDFRISNCFFAEGNRIYLKGQGGNRLFGGGNSPVTIRQDATNEIYLVEVETNITIDGDSSIGDLDNRYYTQSQVNSMIAGKLSTNGSNVMTANLAIQPPSGEGGQVNLRSAISDTAHSGIVVDDLEGKFRVFGDGLGSEQSGLGQIFSIEPYAKTFGSGYVFNGYANKIAYIELTNTSTHTITKGQFVYWNNSLWRATANIAVGGTLSTSNLTEVVLGGLNSLCTITYASLGSLGTGVTMQNVSIRRQSNIVSGYMYWTSQRNAQLTVGTISKSECFPPDRYSYPAYSLDSNAYLGRISISNAGVIIYNPVSGLSSGEDNICSTFNYIVS